MPSWPHDADPTPVSLPRPGTAFRAAALAVLVLCAPAPPTAAAEPEGVARYRKTVAPILEEFCVGCHGGESVKGGVAFDRAEAAELMRNRDLWWRALRMLRAEMMPPKGKPRPTAEQVEQVEAWIKGSAFGIDPKDPDPGRVTVRRLNRVEYRNTVRDLIGVDFNADAAFPADDTGHGFDNIGDVLSLSPLLLEKYIAAARTIVGQAVPTVPRAPPPSGGSPAGCSAPTPGRATARWPCPTTSRPPPRTPSGPSTPAATSSPWT